MSKIPAFVLYGGRWEETTKKFVDNKCKGILVEKNINYNELVEKLYLCLDLNPTEYNITMKIDTSMPECPYMELSNDNDIRFFICLKEKGNVFPLYVSIAG